jgi:hypothetical protein
MRGLYTRTAATAPQSCARLASGLQFPCVGVPPPPEAKPSPLQPGRFSPAGYRPASCVRVNASCVAHREGDGSLSRVCIAWFTPCVLSHSMWRAINVLQLR